MKEFKYKRPKIVDEIYAETPEENRVAIQSLEKQLLALRKSIKCTHENLQDCWYASSPPKRRCNDCGEYFTQKQLNQLRELGAKRSAES